MADTKEMDREQIEQILTMVSEILEDQAGPMEDLSASMERAIQGIHPAVLALLAAAERNRQMAKVLRDELAKLKK